MVGLGFGLWGWVGFTCLLVVVEASNSKSFERKSMFIIVNLYEMVGICDGK